MNIWLTVLSVLLIVFIPVTLAALVRRRFHTPWLYFFVGVATFLAAQVVHIPLNELLVRLGILPEGEGGSIMVTGLVLGLTAGVTEELARTGGYALVRRARGYYDGVMMGVGHGGIEAMVIAVLAGAGASSMWYVQNLEALPSGATAEQFETLRQQLSLSNSIPLVAMLPLVERLIALSMQVSLSILVLQVFTHRRRGYLYLIAAILIHAAFDFVAVVGINTIDDIWLLEGVLTLAVLPVLFWAWRVRPRDLDSRPSTPDSRRAAIGLFFVTLGKELRYQWRSRRAIIILVVFILFGMTSPLVAKFTPQILSNLEGAEQFAAIIPEPTINDAMGQYLSNLTQFGFLLVILLGMGAVAGEKEKGTAAMILSKPLPRWIFLWSKYTAQGLVYLAALVLAAASAYGYTIYLFGPLDLDAFLAANALIYLWFMVYAAATLLGSSLGRTTGAAAGFAALFSVLLLVSSTIPKYGALAPGGLVSWAGQLSTAADGAPNGGGVVMSLALIVLLLLGAVAALDEQEV